MDESIMVKVLAGISILALVIALASGFYAVGMKGQIASQENHISTLEAQVTSLTTEVREIRGVPDLNEQIIRHQIITMLNGEYKDFPVTASIIRVDVVALELGKNEIPTFYPSSLPNKTLYEITRADGEGQGLHIVYDPETKEVLHTVVRQDYITTGGL